MNYDLSAFCGHWPFRHLRRSSVQEQLGAYEAAGITGGLMSSLDAVFYQDPWEADGPLLDALTGTRWELAMCVDPRLPWAEMAVRRAHSRGVGHLRLYPGIHRYSPECADDICAVAGELGMTVTITGRMEDERLCYLLQQEPVYTEACFALAERHPKVNFLLSGFYLGELLDCGPVPENLWSDTSGLCHGLRPVQVLTEGGFPPEKLLFGSLSPLQCLQSHLLNLPQMYKDQILSANPSRFLEGKYDGF